MLDASDDTARSGGKAHPSPPEGEMDGGRRWTFFTNHFAVLACVAADPAMRMRDIAQSAEITERAAQAILHDLVEAGYVERTRIGRRNRYEVRGAEPLRRGRFEGVTIGDLLALITDQTV